jgi:hypothetical protein
MTNSLAVTELRHFQIKGNGSPNDQHPCQAYKNGRQQIEVDIVIDAWAGPNGPVVSLTQEQLRSVKLINYDSGAVVDGQFSRSYEKNVYEVLAGTSPFDQGSVDVNMSVITFYVSLPESTNFVSLQLAAEITLDGATFSTNNRASSPGGGLSNGGFNSSIQVQPLAVYAFKAAAFAVRNAGGIGYGYDPGGTGEKRSLDLWAIRHQDPTYKIYGNDIPNQKPINWFSQYVQGGGDEDRAHYALPVLPLGSRVYLGSNREGSSPNDCWITPYTEVGTAYAVMEKASWFETHHYVSKGVTYYDQNGCGHFFYVNPHEEGSTFRLTDYPAKLSSPIDDHLPDAPSDIDGTRRPDE